MLIKFSELVINDFRIPSFEISAGEILVVGCPNTASFQAVQMELVRLLSKQAIAKNLCVNAPFQFVEYIWDSSVWQRLFPITIQGYLNKHVNKANPVYKKLFDQLNLTLKTKVDSLAGNPRKQLSLYTALSWTNYIMLDFIGVDPQGSEGLYNEIKVLVNNGGAAIIFDWFRQFEHCGTAFIKAEYLGAEL